MGWKDIFKEKQTAEQLEKSRCLGEFKESFSQKVDDTRGQLKEIGDALAEWDTWTKDNLDGVDPKNLPDRVHYLLAQVDRMRDTPTHVRSALKDFDSLTVTDTWGKRADGQRDINRVPNLRASFTSRFYPAQGCAKAIRRCLVEIKAQLAMFEEEQEWRAMYEPKPEPNPVPVGIIPPDKPEPPSTTLIPTVTEFDARRDEF